MRTLEALSPTSLKLFWADPEMWYIRYLAEPRLPRSAQAKPASVGSAFDAMIKNLLFKRFYPNIIVNEHHPFSTVKLLEAQVEPQNREWATEQGLHCLTQYNASGALADLLLETTNLHKLPVFEFRAREKISLRSLEVPILGIPDMSYHRSADSPLTILDWKVNGYCSKSITSPAIGFVKCRDGWSYAEAKPSRTANKSHPKAFPRNVDGVMMSSVPLEETNEDWAAQETTYAWLLGVPPGGKFYCAIEQLCGYPNGQAKPDIRVASFRATVSDGYQEHLIGKYVTCWHAYMTGHIFVTESREASDLKCKMLDGLCTSLMTGDPASPAWEAAIAYISQRNFYDYNHDYRTEILQARGLPCAATGTGIIGAGGLLNMGQFADPQSGLTADGKAVLPCCPSK